jgi:chemotaxis protein MotA
VRQALVAAIDRLPEREKLMMGLYYEQELNLREIGEVMGVTESRVCQLHSQAIARLRAQIAGKLAGRRVKRSAARGQAQVDKISFAGLLLGIIAILGGQMLEGGHVGSLVQPTALLIVLGGTLGAVLLQSPFMFSGVASRWPNGCGCRRSSYPEGHDRSRSKLEPGIAREGLLALENYIPAIKDDFTRKGLQLLVDGADPERIRELLEVEINTFEDEWRQSAKIWDAAGGYSPTIGILGAVMGLIHVMENLSDPTKLGAGLPLPSWRPSTVSAWPT